MTDNHIIHLNIHNESDKILVTSVGCGDLQHAGEVGCGTMGELKIRIETDEWIFEEYVEA